MKPGFFALAALIACNVFAVPVSVKDPAGKPLATVMVSRLPMNPAAVDKSDNGYAASGKRQQAFFTKSDKAPSTESTRPVYSAWSPLIHSV